MFLSIYTQNNKTGKFRTYDAPCNPLSLARSSVVSRKSLTATFNQLKNLLLNTIFLFKKKKHCEKTIVETIDIFKVNKARIAEFVQRSTRFRLES